MSVSLLPNGAKPFAETDDETLFETAQQAEGDASAERWLAADCYAELHQRRYSTRQIAERVGKSKSHIGYCIKAAGNPGCRGDFQEAYEQAKGSVHFSSETPEWETPQELYDLLDAEFGFTIDVCATAENAKCRTRWISQGSLETPWEGVCWMNPPYGREIPKWVEKAYRSSVEQFATVVCLVPARTDTDWWWDYCIHGEIRFLHGRLRFGEAEASAPFPSAVVVFEYGRAASVRWWDAWPS